jgi:hypothetical protein
MTDTRTSMTYMDHLRSVALSGVALIVEKTRTYGPSWKRRLGPGAWFTTVRPWDRLETIVENHGGDVFAAIEAQPMGEDGSALACIRDMRNYLLLIEAEMVARGTVLVERAEPVQPTIVLSEEEVERATDAARDMGAGPVANGRYATLDIGHGESPGLWWEGLTALPELYITGMTSLQNAVRSLSTEGAVVASRVMRDSGDYQVLIRIPCSK